MSTRPSSPEFRDRPLVAAHRAAPADQIDPGVVGGGGVAAEVRRQRGHRILGGADEGAQVSRGRRPGWPGGAPATRSRPSSSTGSGACLGQFTCRRRSGPPRKPAPITTVDASPPPQCGLSVGDQQPFHSGALLRPRGPPINGQSPLAAATVGGHRRERTGSVARCTSSSCAPLPRASLHGRWSARGPRPSPPPAAAGSTLGRSRAEGERRRGEARQARSEESSLILARSASISLRGQPAAPACVRPTHGGGSDGATAMVSARSETSGERRTCRVAGSQAEVRERISGRPVADAAARAPAAMVEA